MVHLSFVYLKGPPCRGFTPLLAEFYNKHGESKNFEIIFVSSDRDESSFKEYYNDMPWLTLDYKERDLKVIYSSNFKLFA
jgi:nucleoredoxin